MKTKLYASGKKTLHVLNDLIRINIDLIAGFEKAAHEEKTPEPELRDAFYRLAVESRSYVNALHAQVIRLGGAPVTQATITGKIYLHWLEGKNRFDGADSQLRLAACRASAEATETAYRQALDEHLSHDLHQLLENQLWALERAHQQLHDLESSITQHDQHH
ncbi:MAG TPA: PA2169 family four-helix-bundle protein [Puia sp.]|nr:PA2169 family four-helix-bundle protein [Puia sp.]